MTDMIIVPPPTPKAMRPARYPKSVQECDAEIEKIDRQISHIDSQIESIDYFIVGLIGSLGFLAVAMVLIVLANKAGLI